ncbi:MAG: kinase/pyrophosphorylase [Burkholderiales bacterium]|jgi:regulator of PEP synthase PpsR (kinase-PPPase family)|nr:kinase/pyrophosphorylase [Burkholderiales bacterium]
MPDSSTSVPERTAFFVSDGTGITAETFGHSILSQFEGLRLRQVRLPFIDELTKAEDAVERINQQGIIDGNRPIVFSTLVNPRINSIVRTANAMFMDLIAAFVEPLEAEFGIKSTHTIGRFHSVAESDTYKKRIEAIHFAMSHDDGQMHKELDQSDVILVGVSRSGKTPTSLYLAVQHGVKAANYPLIPDDFDRGKLPAELYRYKSKLFGLTITPERLSEVRNERRPGSRYASLETCRTEVNQAEAMMRRENIPWLSSTTKSIEEIATTVMTLLDQP